MANTIKYGYSSGKSLVYTVFDEDGTFRTIEHLPLAETRDTGFYTSTSPIDLETGDMIIVYENEQLTYEDEGVWNGSYELVYYGGVQVYYEGKEVFDYDSANVDTVTWTGDPIGCGEYVDQSNIIVLLNSIINSNPSTPTSDTSFSDIAEEIRRALNNQDIGFWEFRD